jgi:hypothetical protein
MMSEPANFRRPGELVFALLIVVFSVTAFWQAYLISGFSGKATPGVFPMLASGIMIVSGVIIVLSAAQTPKKFDNKSGCCSDFIRLQLYYIDAYSGFCDKFRLLSFLLISIFMAEKPIGYVRSNWDHTCCNIRDIPRSISSLLTSRHIFT